MSREFHALIGPDGTDVLTDSEFNHLDRFLRIKRSNTGFSTPVEAFICRLVNQHSARALTLDDIRADVSEGGQLTMDWEGCIENATFLATQYPELLRQCLPAGSVFRTAAEVQEAAEQEQRQAEQERIQAERREASDKRLAEARDLSTQKIDAAHRRNLAWLKANPDAAQRIGDFLDWLDSLEDSDRATAMFLPAMPSFAKDQRSEEIRRVLKTKRAPQSVRSTRGARVQSKEERNASETSSHNDDDNPVEASRGTLHFPPPRFPAELPNNTPEARA